ncbi:MAG: hypothetical protein KJP05_03900 [Deltaproteobacteria bacterium]|nr:hypothetical protein [Deltaproteobacteria bacterium]
MKGRSGETERKSQRVEISRQQAVLRDAVKRRDGDAGTRAENRGQKSEVGDQSTEDR